MQLRRLAPEDAAEFAAFRQRGLQEHPTAFLSSPKDDRTASLATTEETLQSDSSAVFGAFEDGLVGVVGVFRLHHLKAQHKSFIWGMYVEPARRGQGVASSLIDQAIEYSRDELGVRWVGISVSDDAPNARRLYEHLGFEYWGTEPAVLEWNGEVFDEHHLILKLS